LIGKRTWGGSVGHYTLPDDLLDGGGLNAPNLAFYSPDGAWEVESHGVPPDMEVEDDPKRSCRSRFTIGERRRVGDGIAEEESAAVDSTTSAISELPRCYVSDCFAIRISNGVYKYE